MPMLSVVSPTFRPDLPREIDLYEEVLRLYGMDNIPTTLPAGRGCIGVRTNAQLVDAKIHRTFSCGINQTMTYSFAAGDDLDSYA